MRKLLCASLALLPAVAFGQYAGPVYNPASVAITGGTAAFTGVVSTTGNLNVQGVVSSAANTSPASTTNSGVAMNYAAPGGADVDLFDSTQTANNRTGSILYYQGAMRFRFYNDSHGTALEPLVITGGQAAGITGIALNAGSGAVAVTGVLTVSGATTLTGGTATPTILSPGYTVSALPTCNTAAKGARAYVTDAANPTWNSPVTGGSSNTIAVFCNGNSWVAGG
jgi:hypothetical protein